MVGQQRYLTGLACRGEDWSGDAGVTYAGYLAAAVHQWPFCSLIHSGWAREFYDTKITTGKTHHAALRALSNHWLEILWHCPTKTVPYNENTHIANRNHAPGRAP